VLNLNKTIDLSSWSFRAGLLFICCLAVTILVYLPGLNGGYYFDDSHVLQRNDFIKIDNLEFDTLVQAAHSFAGQGRELSMLSFALSYYIFGESTWWFKFINLLLHCLNGVGLFVLTSQLINRMPAGTRTGYADTVITCFPLIVTALWLIHPINLIPVLYISQRMALMSSFFVIYGLVYYVWARSSITSVTRKAVYYPLGIAGFMILGYKCKENAVLLPLYIVAVEITVLKFKQKEQRDNVVVGMFTLGLVTGLVLLVYQFWQHPDWITGGYRNRYFSLEERVLTEFRALVFYIYQILIPSNHHLTLWHDDFGLSTSLFSPKTTVVSLLALLSLFLLAVFTTGKLPLISLGIYWFFVSHALESTVFGLEIIHEHRNYLASFGILLGFVTLAMYLLKNKSAIYFTLTISMFLAFSVVLFQRSNIWSNDFTHAEYEARNRPESAIASFQLGQRYYEAAMRGAKGAENLALPLLIKAASNDRYSVAPELLLVVLSEHENVEYQPVWLQDAIEKIKKHPYMFPSKSALQGYSRCLKQGKCGPHGEDVENFFDTILQTNDDNLLTTAAFYFTQVNVDHERAKLGFKKALRNKAANWVNYLSFLIHVNNLEEACSAYPIFKDKLKKNQLKQIALHAKRLSFFERKLKDC
jgi:hypothetical protein